MSCDDLENRTGVNEKHSSALLDMRLHYYDTPCFVSGLCVVCVCVMLYPLMVVCNVCTLHATSECVYCCAMSRRLDRCPLACFTLCVCVLCVSCVCACVLCICFVVRMNVCTVLHTHSLSLTHTHTGVAHIRVLASRSGNAGSAVLDSDARSRPQRRCGGLVHVQRGRA